MKKHAKSLYVVLACVAIIFAGNFLSHVHISHGGTFFKIGAAVIVVCALAFLMWLLSVYHELSEYKQKEKDNFKFLFPRHLSPYADDVLACLVYDYGLSDGEIERIARDGVHEAVARYRKSHPLDHPPSDDIDFINVFPGPGA